MKSILLTGGLGYIGSHVAIELVESGFEVIILDDLSNSDKFVLNRIEELTRKQIRLYEVDIRDYDSIIKVFDENEIEGVIHFAAKKAVGESVKIPLTYFDVNVSGLLILLKVIETKRIKKFVFSSSCTVYGIPEKLPVTEEAPFGITPSPYGKTKQMCEEILKAYAQVNDYSIVSLRYFNPVGAHKSGRIGELPKGVPNNLVPFITQTAVGIREKLQVFGDDYDTPDGSAIRDYIHVVDLAKAHVKAMVKETGEYSTFNLGTGKGYSVLEVIHTFEEVNNTKVPHEIVGRREGDLPIIYGDPSVANEVLGWKADLGLKDMMKDAWRWEKGLLNNK